jgi:hypothetical protein
MNKMLTITLLVSLFAVNASFGAFKGKWVASQAEDIKSNAEQIHKLSKSERIKGMAQNISNSASELHKSGKSEQQNGHGNGQDASDVSGEYSGTRQRPEDQNKDQQMQRPVSERERQGPVVYIYEENQETTPAESARVYEQVEEAPVEEEQSLLGLGVFENDNNE